MWIEQLPNGKYRYCERFKNPHTGKVKKISLVSSKKNDKANMSVKLYEAYTATLGAPSASSEVSFKELSEKWFSVYEQTVKKSTSSNIKGRLKIINSELADYKMNEFKPQVINRYLLDRLQNKGNKRATISLDKSIIERVLDFGISYGYYTDISYKTQIMLPKINLSKKDELKYLERDELKQVLDWVKETYGDEHYRLVYLQANTGMRYNELVALNYNTDIDLVNKTISITKNYDAKNNLFTTPKTGDARTIFISDRMVSLIKEQIAYDQLKMMRHNLSRENTLLFRSWYDKPIHISTMNDKLRHIKFIPGKTISTHIFRHTFVTIMLENNIEPKLIAKHLGHSSTKMIDRVYSHFSDKMNRQLQHAVDAVEI